MAHQFSSDPPAPLNTHQKILAFMHGSAHCLCLSCIFGTENSWRKSCTGWATTSSWLQPLLGPQCCCPPHLYLLSETSSSVTLGDHSKCSNTLLFNLYSHTQQINLSPTSGPSGLLSFYFPPPFYKQLLIQTHLHLLSQRCVPPSVPFTLLMPTGRL